MMQLDIPRDQYKLAQENTGLITRNGDIGQHYDHAVLSAWVEGLIALYRPYLKLEEMWSISVLICCPEELPKAEADMRWHSDTWRAELRIRCTLLPDLMEWLVAHELLELSRWRTSDSIQDMLKLLRRLMGSSRASQEMIFFIEQHIHRGRNQEIEQVVSLFLAAVRPTLSLQGTL